MAMVFWVPENKPFMTYGVKYFGNADPDVAV